MKEKKDIFNGKIKKEYFSYILIYMIFIALLILVAGVMILGVGLWANAGSVHAIIFMRILGVVIIVLGIAYVVGCMLVIRKYPKYEKIRRILYNSDCYFTGSDSKEYYGRISGIRGRRYKAAFDLVTAIAEAEKSMGDKKPVRYTVYMVLSILFSVIGFAWFFGALLLFDKGTIFPHMSDGVFAILLLSVDIVCISLAIVFFIRAYKIALMAPFENFNRKYELYSALVDISVRQNNKKHKFWYDIDQLEQIENLVKSASENAELKLETKDDKFVSFKVVDTLNHHVIFTGLFT